MTLTQEAVLDREQAYEEPEYVQAPWNDQAKVNLEPYTERLEIATERIKTKLSTRSDKLLENFAWNFRTEDIDAMIDYLTDIYDARSHTEKFEQEDTGI